MDGSARRQLVCMCARMHAHARIQACLDTVCGSRGHTRSGELVAMHAFKEAGCHNTIALHALGGGGRVLQMLVPL